MMVLQHLPSDKSISHRAIIFASLLAGKRILYGSDFGADVFSTIACFEAFGVEFSVSDTQITVCSPGWQQFIKPQRPLDAGNSGTTARLLMGICAALPFTVTISGDASLVKRPMRRIAEPLRLMGAKIELSETGCLPATITGGQLQAIDYQMPVASAQLKSALLLAALVAGVPIVIHETQQSRNHTELFLQMIGASISCSELTIRFQPGTEYQLAATYTIPGDASSAAFWVVWATIASDSDLRIEHVSLNPTRIGYISVLQTMGAAITLEPSIVGTSNEIVGTIHVKSSQLHGVDVQAGMIANIIDEIPVLALAAGCADGETCFHAVAELRVKESNRLEAITKLLTKIGVCSTVVGNDLHITGTKQLYGGIIQTYHDHRIAMCAMIASLLVAGDIEIDDYDCIAVSYPNFLLHLEQVIEGSRIIK